MSDWDDEDDNTPDSEQPGPAYKLTIEGLPQSAIMDAVLDRAARDLAAQITDEQRKEFRAQVLQKLDDVIAKISDARLEKEINALIDEGWQQHDRWGKPSGPKKTLRDLVTTYLMTNVDQHGRDSSDRYADSNRQQRVEWYVQKAINSIFDKEMQNVIERFRKTVRERFDAKLAADVAETIKSAIGCADITTRQETTMKTQEEIVARLNQSDSMFGFDRSVLVPFLDLEHAKPFLVPDMTDWTQVPLDRETVLNQMREYMDFAWRKVEDHRGLSASRSVEKFEAWLWLLGDEPVIADFDAAPYENYGAPKLHVVCKAYGLPVPESERCRT